jgi:hypothetical protein
VILASGGFEHDRERRLAQHGSLTEDRSMGALGNTGDGTPAGQRIGADRMPRQTARRALGSAARERQRREVSARSARLCPPDHATAMQNIYDDDQLDRVCCTVDLQYAEQNSGTCRTS